MALLVVFAGALTYAQEAQNSDYRIAVGDLLRIEVHGEPDFSKEARVAADGTITYSPLGNIDVAGFTAREVEITLVGLLKEGYFLDPKVSVFIKEYAKVYVLGEVKKPGAYELKAGLTAVEAIALAGGFDEYAAGDATKIIRKDGDKNIVIVVPITTILHTGNKSKDVLLKANDTISVPESFF
jgi:polysaccharide export outer membrane protein